MCQAWEKTFIPYLHQDLWHGSAFDGAFCGTSLFVSQAALKSRVQGPSFPLSLACCPHHCSLAPSLCPQLARSIVSSLARLLPLCTFPLLLNRQR